jgi:hypothetical protein
LGSDGKQREDLLVASSVQGPSALAVAAHGAPSAPGEIIAVTWQQDDPVAGSAVALALVRCRR